jgi:hypothetical protein
LVEHPESRRRRGSKDVLPGQRLHIAPGDRGIALQPDSTGAHNVHRDSHDVQSIQFLGDIGGCAEWNLYILGICWRWEGQIVDRGRDPDKVRPAAPGLADDSNAVIPLSRHREARVFG